MPARNYVRDILEAILRFLLIAAGTLGVPQLLHLILKTNIFDTFFVGEYHTALELAVPLIPTLPLFFILVYEAVLYHPDMHRHADAPLWRHLLRQPEFLIGNAILAALVCILPLPALNPVLPDLFDALGVNPPAIAVRLTLLALLLAESVFAAMLAITSREAADVTEEFPRPAIIGKTVFYSLLFLLGGIVVYIFVPYIGKLAPVAAEILRMKFVRVILAVLIALFVFSCTRALIKRRRCLKRLYALCTGLHRRCERVKRPYLSVLFPSHSLPFEIKVDDERFACKLISGRRTYTRMQVCENGVCRYVIPIKIRHIELCEIKLPIRFGFESKHRKIVVFNPSPNYLFVEYEKLRTPLDNGAQVGDYTIYNTTAFLNVIERGSLGK